MALPLQVVTLCCAQRACTDCCWLDFLQDVDKREFVEAEDSDLSDFEVGEAPDLNCQPERGGLLLQLALMSLLSFSGHG